MTKNGIPQSPNDLVNHQCITFMSNANWEFKAPNGSISIKAEGNFRTDNGEAIRDACVNGLGITISSVWSIYKHLKSGQLQHILQDFPLISHTDIWAVYPSSRLLAPKVRAFIDYFSGHFGDTPYWEE